MFEKEVIWLERFGSFSAEEQSKTEDKSVKGHDADTANLSHNLRQLPNQEIVQILEHMKLAT